MPRALNDTDPDSASVRWDVYRNLTAEQRFEVAWDLSEAVRAVAKDGIRDRHPHYTNDEVHRAYCRLAWGDALVREVWPAHPLVAP